MVKLFKMRKIHSFFLCLTVCLLPVFYGLSCKGKGDQLATIGDKQITKEAFKAEMQKRGPRIASEKDKENLLDEMVNFETLYAAALKKGYDRDPKIMENLRRMIAGKLRKEELEPKINAISVTDGEIEKYYKTHTDEFMIPERVRAALTRVALPKKASEEKKSELRLRIDEARAEALKLDNETKSFGSVAVKYSDDRTTRYRGGNTGWLEPVRKSYRWDKLVLDAIFSLREPGVVSPVIKAPDGYYIAKLMERQESRPQALSKVAGKIRHLLIQEKKRYAERKFYDSMKKKVSVKVYKENLASVELPKPKEKKFQEPPALPKG